MEMILKIIKRSLIKIVDSVSNNRLADVEERFWFGESNKEQINDKGMDV